MTITVVSGLPGHGKTLLTLWHVEQLRRATGRTVYVHGVTDLSLPWLPLDDPRKWHELPDASVVVVDEAWKFFPKRGPGSAVPTHVEQLAVHRHRGFDIFLVTQNPALQLDHFARGLVGEHLHVRRVFGSARSRLYRWEELGSPDDYHSKQKAIKSWFTFPKEVFTWYKSAEVHTVKRQLPWRILVPTAVAVVALPLLGWWAFSSLRNTALAASGEEVSQDDKQGRNDKQGGPFGQDREASFTPADFVPAVAGIPYTIPAFSRGLEVSAAPIIAGCGVLKIGTQVECRCNDQQGNVVDLEHRQCLAYFERGAFDPAGSKRYPEIEPYVPPLAGPGNGGGTPADQPQAGGGGTQSEARSANNS